MNDTWVCGIKDVSWQEGMLPLCKEIGHDHFKIKGDTVVERIEIKDEGIPGNHVFTETTSPHEERQFDWQEQAHLQWALRTEGPNTILMKRTADENGLDYRGDPQTWLDVAMFYNYRDAVTVFGTLTGAGT